MTQPFTDALTWMPKSRALGATLTRAHDLARAHGHATVTLEHLLQALVEDPDASSLLLGCNVDLLKLNSAAAAHVQAQPSAGGEPPEASQGLLLILEYAAAAARQSKRSDVNGAIVLAAMAGEGKSDAARMLQAAGLKFEDAIAALRRGGPQSRTPPQPEATAPAPLAREKSAPPPMPPSLPETGNTATDTPAPSAVSRPPAGDGDPIVTARRRIEALRNGRDPGPLPLPNVASRTNGHGHGANGTVPPPSSPQPVAVAAGAPAAFQSGPQSEAWAPQPLPSLAAAPRTVRMPPPVPPLPDAPPRTNGANGRQAASAAASIAPWTDPAIEQAAAAAITPVPASTDGTPIDPRELGDNFPTKMRDRVPSTVEVRIPRSAVLATAAALKAGAHGNSDTALTRAVTVRLKAPAGGLHVESAAPETQWFDTRGVQRGGNEEVRWRWMVTPHLTGARQLQVSVTIRMIAADGTMIETTLPEHSTTVKVGSNFREGMRRVGRGALALCAGVALGYLASGGLGTLFGGLLK